MKVSIITVNFNNAMGLKATLESVSRQSYKDYEVIVVDGASTDESVDVIKSYIPRIADLSYVSEKDSGIYNAMNKGIRMSSGDYLNFMNSGDIFYNELTLEQILPFLQQGKAIVTGIGYAENYEIRPPKPAELSLTFFLKNSMNHQAAFIKAAVMKQYMYNENYKIVSDTEFFFRALVLDNCSYLDVSVNVCACEKAGASGNLNESLQERYRAIKALLPDRMSPDADFIIKYDNPIIRCIGNVLYNKFFRLLYDKIIRRGRRI